MKKGLTGCPNMLARNYHSVLCKITKEADLKNLQDKRKKGTATNRM
jgi:hypothetical protein